MKRGFITVELWRLEELLRLKDGINIVHIETNIRYPNVANIYIEGEQLSSIGRFCEVQACAIKDVTIHRKGGENE